MCEGLKCLRYPTWRIELPLVQCNGVKSADIVGFCSTYPSQKSACLAAQYCPSHNDVNKYLNVIAQVGVQYVYLLHSTGSGHIWKLEFNRQKPESLDPKPYKNLSIELSQLSSFLLIIQIHLNHK